jgi:hypothetical protein
MANRGRPKKNKFDDLDTDFKDSVAGMSEEQIRAKLAEVALNQAALMAAKSEDEDLKEKKAIAKEAGAQYSEGTKMNRLRTEFCRQVLGDKGKDNGSFSSEQA